MSSPAAPRPLDGDVESTGQAPGRPIGVDAVRVAVAGGDVSEKLACAVALVEHAPDAVVVLDCDTGRFASVNAAAEQLFGLDRARLVRVGPVELSPPAQPDGCRSADAAWAYVEEALAGGRPRFEWTHLRADGTPVPCEITLLRLPSVDRRLVRGSIEDVTERRRAEAARAAVLAEEAARQAAEAGKARFEALVAGLNAVVWERDPVTLRCSYINDRVEELLGYPVARWLAEPQLWERILHPEDQVTAVRRVQQAVAGNEVDFSLSYRVRTRDGRWLWLQHLGHVARDDAGRARTLHVVLTDITDARRREQAAALLAAAGQAMIAPGSVEQRLTAVAELTVGDVGNRAVVWLRGDDDRHRVVAAAPADLAARIRNAPALTVPEELRPLVDAGRPFIVGEVSDQLRRAAAGGDGGFTQLAAELGGGHSRLVVPLLTGGQRVGLLTVSSTEPDRGYDDADLALAGDLGQRMAAMVAAERVAARQRQLHSLTAALSAAGTVAEAAAALTAGLRGALAASVVAVCTLGPDGLLHTIEARGYPPERLAQFATMRLSAPFPIPESARTRRPVWLADRAAVAQRFPEAAPRLQASTEAAAALPLLVADRVVGVLGVTFSTPRRFDDDERAFLRTVADQLALTLERATLADVRREMAEVLQRSLLPVRVPEVDGLEVVTRYLPAVRGTAAGGDWYDVHRLSCGRAAVAVGDTVGHGSAAAAVMGVLRNSLAALLVAGHPPAEALSLLDAVADDVPGAAVSTVACLRLDPATGELTYSRAGHPPPLLIDTDGGVTWLDEAPGRALGLPDHGARPEATITLPVGATLLCFTDGLVERRGEILDAGLARLAAAATARRAAPLAALVDGVLADLVDVDGADDDVALVAIRTRRRPARESPSPGV